LIYNRYIIICDINLFYNFIIKLLIELHKWPEEHWLNSKH